MLWQRIASALIGIPILLWLLISGGWPLLFVVLLVVLLGVKEYCDMFSLGQGAYPRLAAYLLAAGLVLSTAGMIPLGPLVFGVLASLLVYLAWAFPQGSGLEIGRAFFGAFYIGWMFSHVILLRALNPQGDALVVLVFLLIWATDSGAYFVGRAWGKHKLAPRVSPGKTIEGAIGGVLAAVLVGLAWESHYQLLGWIPVALLAAVASFVGQVGDLAESALKREAGVKDSGTLIPGHGGVLDRFDSLFLAAPTVYYFAAWLVVAKG